jgi:hypothetical protein
VYEGHDRTTNEVKSTGIASLRTEVSVAGKQNFEGRDKAAETAGKILGHRFRERISLNNPAHSGGFRDHREISVRTRMRGGAMRTRTMAR